MRVLVNGESFEVEVLQRERNQVTFALEGRSYRVELERAVPASPINEKEAPEAPIKKTPAAKKKPAPRAAGEAPASGALPVYAPIPGVIAAVLVKAGDSVNEGAVLLRLEAMKMENNVYAPSAGTVRRVCVTAGQEVCDQELLIELDAD